METGYTHCYDHLTIQDMISGESWDLCGEEVPGDLELQTNSISVSLFTDSYNNYDGFRMFFQTTGEATHSSPSSSSPTPATTTESSCGEGEWECGSGECLELPLLCDGNINCQDGSDEADCSPNTSNE